MHAVIWLLPPMDGLMVPAGHGRIGCAAAGSQKLPVVQMEQVLDAVQYDPAAQVPGVVRPSAPQKKLSGHAEQSATEPVAPPVALL